MNNKLGALPHFTLHFQSGTDEISPFTYSQQAKMSTGCKISRTLWDAETNPIVYNLKLDLFFHRTASLVKSNLQARMVGFRMTYNIAQRLLRDPVESKLHFAG